MSKKNKMSEKVRLNGLKSLKEAQQLRENAKKTLAKPQGLFGYLFGLRSSV